MDVQDIKAQFSGKITRAAFLALELDCLFFPPHTDNIGTPAVILLDKSGQRFYIHVEIYDFGDRDEIGVLHITDVEQVEAKIIEYIMQNALPINVDLSGFKIDLIETSINEILVETGIHLSDSIQAIIPTALRIDLCPLP